MPADDRSAIFEKVRQAIAPLGERTPYPDYDLAMTVSGPKVEGDNTLEVFRRNLEGVHGRLFTDAAGLAAFLRDAGHIRGYCDPSLTPLLGSALAAAGLEVVTAFERADYDQLAFGITRGTAAIAESGTIVIDDNKTSDRLAALAPWVHVAVLRTDEILPTIAEAVERLGSSPNIIWCTGPSKPPTSKASSSRACTDPVNKSPSCSRRFNNFPIPESTREKNRRHPNCQHRPPHGPAPAHEGAAG